MTATETATRQADANEIVHQIGRNIFAISGGRVGAHYEPAGQFIDGIEMPAGKGYWVTVTVAADDTYTVTREFRRSGKATNKGTVAGVYCDEVGEVAYQASCYQNRNFG